MGWKTLEDMDLAGKTVLTRVDINVPVENSQVTDMTRFARIRPTIETRPEVQNRPGVGDLHQKQQCN